VTPVHGSALIPAAAGRPGDDPIFALNAEASARAAKGESIVNATLGALLEDDGSLAILPSVVEAFGRVPAKRASAYAPILGDPGFLRAVVDDLFGARGSGLGSRAVAAATPGGSGAIHHAIQNFLEPGEALLTTDRFWVPYKTIADHAGRRVETFAMFDGEGRFDLAAFERGVLDLSARQRRVLVLLNFPCHNPTGYSLDAGEWRGIGDVLGRAGERGPVSILIDHAYAKFGVQDGRDFVEHASGWIDSATLLVAWTASKSFAQYGARVGALVAVAKDAREREAIRNALGFSCRGTWSNCNHLGQLAIASLLVDRSLRERVEKERGALLSLLGERVAAFNLEAARAELAHPRYEGGFFVCVFTKDGERTAAAMRERGVYVVPMRVAVRVALCSTPARDVPRLVAALREGVVR
jgi:aromatic-amino-acid transaminase